MRKVELGEGAGEGGTLLLAHGERAQGFIGAGFEFDGVEGPGHGVVRGGGVGGEASHGDHGAHGKGEGDGGALRDVGEAGGARGARDRGERSLAKRDDSGGGFEEAEEEFEESGLADAVGADDRGDGGGGEGGGNGAEDGLAFGIGEREALALEG